jgi:hypothetical protein
LVKRLNAGEDTAEEIGKNWASSGPAFLQDAFDKGISRLFTALYQNSLVFPQLIAQDIANTTEVASGLHLIHFRSLIANSATISSELFSKVNEIGYFDGVPSGSVILWIGSQVISC